MNRKQDSRKVSARVVSRLKALALYCDTGLLADRLAWSKDCDALAALQAAIVRVVERHDREVQP